MFINGLSKAIGMLALFSLADAFSMPDKQFYASVNTGIFSANFNTKYLDQSDIIPQNISESVLQNGYTGGVAFGYNQVVHAHYFLGGEISAHINSDSAEYQSGAATAAFSDSLKLKNYFDFTVVSGIITQSSYIPYLKLGISYAAIRDNLTSPVSYTPEINNYPSDKNALGFAAGLGVRHFLSKKIFLFSEINYYDYGTLKFQDFQNFTADYTHSARLCSYGLIVGAAYSFNV